VQRLTYALRFIKASFSLAFKNPRLRMPWFYLWMGGIALLAFWLFPLGVTLTLLGLRPFGMILIGLLISLLLFVLIVWGEITALETCWAFDSLIQVDEQPVETPAQRREFSRWWDVFLWLLILPGSEVIRFFTPLISVDYAAKHDWLAAGYLMLPVISIEDLNQQDAAERVKQLVSDRLLRFHPDLVGIRPLVGITQWALIVSGAILGFWVGLRIADPVTAGLLSQLLAMATGIALAGVLALLGIFLSSFSRACYFTTLYQWVLNVESARRLGVASQGLPPAILSQVMAQTKSSKKEET
jgi:hypothetical protein